MELAHEWRKRQLAADRRVTVQNLYAGRGVQLAAEVAKTSGSAFRIVSAGMGLLRPSVTIAPYSLTLTPDNPDCILNRAPRSITFGAQDWWQAIRSPRSGASPFGRLLSAHPESLLVLAVTQPYLDMIAGEISSLAEQHLERIRIVGLARLRNVRKELHACVMPYDLRLNDVSRSIRGTTFDYSSRALQHFVELVGGDRRIDAAGVHARRVRQALAHWSVPELSARIRVDDSALLREIRKLKLQSRSRTAGLRHLRQERGIACAQARFASAWGGS